MSWLGSLASAGATVVVLLAVLPCTASAALPIVSLTGVSPGQTVSGTVALGAGATGASQVKWYVDYVEVGWDGAAPWQVNWNSDSVGDGIHVAFAKAADAGGLWGISQIVTFYVDNTAPPPDTAATLTWPTAGSTVSGSFNLTATAPSSADEMKWYVDGTEVGWDGTAPWSASWNSAGVSNGTHAIFTKTLISGAWLASPQVSFTVQNGDVGPAPGPPPDSKWRLLLSEDFNGSAVDLSRWYVYGPNAPGHNGNGLRDGRAVSVANGLLTITAQMINGVLVSSGIQSRIDRTYGRYEFRVRTDADWSGATNAAVLTWPQSQNWPTDGENNIYETNSPSRNPFWSFVHYSPQNRQYWFIHSGADGTQWHTMAMEWEPNEIRIYRDGVHVWSVTDTYAIPDVPHHVDIQLDAQKSWMSGAVRLQVDYMRIYERAW